MEYKTPKVITAKNGSIIVDFTINDPIEDVVKIVARTLRKNLLFRIYQYDPGVELQYKMFCFAVNKKAAVEAIAAFYEQTDLSEIRSFVTREVK